MVLGRHDRNTVKKVPKAQVGKSAPKHKQAEIRRGMKVDKRKK